MEKRGAIEAALAGGMEPAEILKAVLQNVYGVSERKKKSSTGEEKWAWSLASLCV
jgi:hypothetical protein